MGEIENIMRLVWGLCVVAVACKSLQKCAKHAVKLLYFCDFHALIYAVDSIITHAKLYRLYAKLLAKSRIACPTTCAALWGDTTHFLNASTKLLYQPRILLADKGLGTLL